MSDPKKLLENAVNTMPFASFIGVEAVEMSPEQVAGTLVVKPELCTIGNSVHGGTLMAFADSLAAIGAFLNLPEGAGGTTTIESKTNFVGGASAGETLRAVATPVSVGKRLSVWRTDITTESGKLVAVVTQSQLVL